MTFEKNKVIVLNLFDEHIKKYIVKDLKVLNAIIPDDSGNGGCAIPQALATFSAIDLIGYLCHPQDIKTVYMSFSDLLKNEKFFPEFKDFSSDLTFFDSFKDNVRSIMVHRFSMAKFDIAKSNVEHLFFESYDRQIFNITYFTKIVLRTIESIYNQILSDTFVINGFTNDVTIEKMAKKILKLKDYDGSNFLPLQNLPSITVTTQTTRSLSE
jgi:hypothetical protein